ncbi:imidazole glycerol phosphate synthase subunit HisH [Oleiphilus messinensis]|uniref:Imidazole glycerol phosphate synthase subunit HisH n=2 Tax=Oleiphilus messinensis TaxID=141451 RepID=A0A1Y0IHJ1_9GAMM|nr:imidazole glycerol phosphate synthase subunit HisH [Oleiphilus messinensis]
MLKKIGAEASITSDPGALREATAIILPGIGAFDNGMSKLERFIVPLEQKVLEEKVPFLGICLGMQLLLERSDEGTRAGLGWIPGEVKKFSFTHTQKKLKVPHMGWNVVSPAREDGLFNGFEEEARFYFVHTYHAVVKHKEHTLGTTVYGYDFASAIHKDNIFGVQFHPEKSHKFGMNLLKNFISLSLC